MQVCSVVLTRNHDGAVKLLKHPQIERIPPDLLAELRHTAEVPRITLLSRLVRVSYYLPAWIQFLGQRAVLVSPRLAHWVLRKTRIHHRWY
jgi:hypothetical protein